MILFKPYVDVFRWTNSSNEVTYWISVSILANCEVGSTIDFHESFVNSASGGTFQAKLEIDVAESSPLSSPEIFTWEILIGEIDFSEGNPLLKVSLFDSVEGSHLGKSISHQEDIEEEEMPTGG